MESWTIRETSSSLQRVSSILDRFVECGFNYGQTCGVGGSFQSPNNSLVWDRAPGTLADARRPHSSSVRGINNEYTSSSRRSSCLCGIKQIRKKNSRKKRLSRVLTFWLVGSAFWAHTVASTLIRDLGKNVTWIDMGALFILAWIYGRSQ